ncbi:MAG: hypothetical protein K8S13_08210 [Desulfobacula sp.]|uniref:hypothetical protein n=1 Tax=Desulfobacula sp. TaxID=2593537 RepID=UPI0025BA1601|nr:hypothetical protein [Desulfobacula sp.]MCD4719830.1 hypothetical protein [Desulfobacula sp.]
MKNKIYIICSITGIALAAVFYLFPWDDIQSIPSSQTALISHAATAMPEPLTKSLMDKNKTFDPALSSEQLPVLPPLAESVPKNRDQVVNNDEILPAEPLEDMAENPADVDEEAVYLTAQVFRDEALETFPVYTVRIHKPESIGSDFEESGSQAAEQKAFGPGSNEIWIRIKPENAREMKEVMAQTADLYRQYVNEYDKDVKVINWVGGQPWASIVYSPDGGIVTR